MSLPPMPPAPSAAAPPDDQTADTTTKWDPVTAARDRYPGLSSDSDITILQHLSDPAKFRSAFPEYAQMSDGDIQKGVSRELSSRTTDFQKTNTPQPYWGFLPSHLYDQAKEGVEGLASGTYGLAKDIVTQPFATTYQKDVAAPLEDELDKSSQAWKEGRRSEAVGHYVASYLPFLGPWAANLGEQAGTGDIGGAMAKAGAQYGAVKAVESLPAIGKSATRYATGAGDTAVEAARTADAAKSSAAQSEYAQKSSDVADANRQSLAEARQAHEQRVSDVQFENDRARTAYQDSLARVRRANAESQAAVAHGQASESAAQQQAAQVADALPKLADAETAKARAAYPKVNGTLDPAEVHSNLQAIADDKLRGAGPVPSSLARALAETRTETPLDQASVFRGQGAAGRSIRGVGAGEALQSMPPEARARYLSTLDLAERAMVDPTSAPVPGGEPVTFDKLHGIYSELGRELFTRDLPGDSRAALGAAREWIGSKMRELASAEDKQDQFKSAQAGWRVLENTFRNTDPVASGGSPIARALRAKDPVTGELRQDYVRQILTDDKAHGVAQQLLQRYPSAGPVANAIQLMKAHADAADAAPSTAKVEPEPTAPLEKPMPLSAPISVKKMPPPPPPSNFDPIAFREHQMGKTAVEWQKLRPFNFMPWRIPYTVVQQVLARMLADPKFRARIARP